MVENETRSISNFLVPSAANRAPREIYSHGACAPAGDEFRTALGWADRRNGGAITGGVQLVDFEAVINRPDERR
jgi:hypothetical protein